jgi:D-alanine-D-alanine ligase and related ATP-grasp enzymes
VKPVKEEASYGISQASFVETDEQFRERVAFVHEKYASDAIAEEYIEGRELYVGLMGNVRLTVFPIRELVFREVPPNEPKIATYKAKWDEEYRKRWGQNQFAEGLDPALVAHIEDTCKRIYRLLTIDGYARIDLRLSADKKVYFIEANPNPILAETRTSRFRRARQAAVSAIDRPDHPARDEDGSGLSEERSTSNTRGRSQKQLLTRKRADRFLQEASSKLRG